ncbi:Highly reducing polyketide synthase gloL [Paramyrothecium foliicola]|nr:Highly reducing polyketide synthase gloL [Paramyrothecium foliicola]
MSPSGRPPPPIAIVGLGMRLPGGVSTPSDFWEFLVNKKDGKCRVPADRYDVNASFGSTASRQAVATEYGYFLDVNLKAGDGSFFPFKQKEVENLDPQQRLLLEVCHECLESAGSTSLKGSNAGVFVGNFGEDWHNMSHADPQSSPNMFRIHTAKVLGITRCRLSVPLSSFSSFARKQADPSDSSITTRTACSASMTSLHLACQALYNGDCSAALVAGSSLILSPSMTMDMTEQGVLSPTGSCKTFDASADGFARGEAINAVLIKPLEAALRDNDPIRAVIRATAVNSDGGTTAIGQPSQLCQEVMIRHAYQVAGIDDISLTPFVECHGTGTQTGDPIEAKAVANVFAGRPTYIGSVKSNFGHAEGAAGLNSVIKAVLALENESIPPNIHYSTPNPHIPFEDGDIHVPTEAVPWPKDRPQRISINSFGIGGANAHAIIESASSHGISSCRSVKVERQDCLPKYTNGSLTSAENPPVNGTGYFHQNGNGHKITNHDIPSLILLSAASSKSLKQKMVDINEYVQTRPGCVDALAYTLAFRRQHLAHRSFCIADNLDEPLSFSAAPKVRESPNVVFVFTGQGAQWSGMGRDMIQRCHSFHKDILEMDRVLQTLPDPPAWSLEEILCSDGSADVINTAEYAQPLCTAIQIALVNFLAACRIFPEAVVGHSSGEIAAAYAVGALTLAEAIVCAYYRGVAIKRVSRTGCMAAVGMGRQDIESLLAPGTQVACENSPDSVTISGDADGVQSTIGAIKNANPDTFVRQLYVNIAYHSEHMQDCASPYEELIRSHILSKEASIPFYSSVTGYKVASKMGLGPSYWRSNLESPVLFRSAVEMILQDFTSQLAFLEIGPHSALQGPLRQIFRHKSSSKIPLYVPTQIRDQSAVHSALSAVGQLHAAGYEVDFSFFIPKATTLPDLPRYPWDHSVEVWSESRVSKAWRFRSMPHHELLGSKCLEATDAEPAWRNIFHLHNVLWIADHKLGDQVLFPLAGYISMLGEAIRQISGSESYTIRQMIMKSGMLIPKSGPIEIMTTSRQARVTEMTNSSWYEFSVYSYNGATWVQHCVAQGKSIQKEPAPRCERMVVPNARKLPEATFYRGLRSFGLELGPAFQNLQNIVFSRDKEVATTKMRPLPAEPTAKYTAHPYLIDLCFQLATVAAIRGQTNRKALMLPSYVKKIEVYSGDIESFTQAEVNPEPNGSFTANIVTLNNDDEVVMKVEGGTWLPVGVDVTNSEISRPISAHMEWYPHVNFCKLDKYTFPRQGQYESKLALQKATALLILEMQGSPREIEDPRLDSHMGQYIRWLSHEHEKLVNGEWDLKIPEIAQWATLDARNRKNLLDEALELAITTCGEYGESFVQLAKKLTDSEIWRALVSGETTLEATLSEAHTDLLYSTIDTIDAAQFFYLAAHSKPNLRVLEISSGSASVTKSIIAAISASDGPMFSEYTFATQCSEKLARAKRLLEGKHELVYKVLDTSKSVTEQEFDLQSYDLIIHSNMIDIAAITDSTFATLRSLLNPGGWLCTWKPVSHSISSTWLFIPMILGLQPSWWQNDEPFSTPYDSVDHWREMLEKAGFSNKLTLTDDSLQFSLNTLLISQLKTMDHIPLRSVTMLYETNKPEFAVLLAAILEKEEVKVRWMKLSDNDPIDGEAVISTFDLERPYLYEFTEATYAALLGYMRRTKSRITWLTRPAQVRCSDPRYGLVPGFMRTLRQELGVQVFTIEVDVLNVTTAALVVPLLRDIANFDILSAPETVDYEFYLSEDGVNVGRYHWFSMSAEIQAPVQDQGKSIKRLKVGEYGLLSSLHWVQQDQPSLPPNHVEIQVKWCGLNFRDLMVAMGVVPAAKDNFGIEASGIITRVGESVNNFVIGDEVIVMAPGSLASRIVVDAYQVVLSPARISLEEAGTIAVAYSTASLALIMEGKLRKGQSVLVHTACGSVGLAAIMISQAFGFDIYATVGSETKIQYLEQRFGIPRSRIFHSRDDSFYDGVMRATGGRGVDLVLNSLSGELLHASWKCVARRGKMIEIGKRDMFERGQLPLEMFRHNRTCVGLDMEDFQEYVADVDRSEKSKLEQGIEAVRVHGLPTIEPRHVFTPENIADAFRFLRKGEHIGKVLIKFPDNQDDIFAIPDTNKALFNPKLTYLMVGGLGGLGKSLAIWFMEKGARNFVFLSRSAGSSDSDQEFVRDLESYGCRVIPIAGSVTDAADVQRAVSAAETPIAGVIQMSMLIRELPLSETNFENWSDGIASKVAGTWNLHHALADVELDFFILFSSLIGLWGQVGQANYAAANTFLDSFVDYRHGLGLPCSVIDLGPVEDIGWVSQNEKMVKYYQSLNLHMVQEKDILEAVQYCIRTSLPGKTVQPYQGHSSTSHIAVGLATANSGSNSLLQHDIRTRLCKSVQSVETDALDPASEAMRKILKDVASDPQILYKDTTLHDISMALGQVIYNMLQLPTDEIDVSKDFTSLGVDSLHGVELRDKLRRVMLLDISIIDIKTAATIGGLGKLILEKLKVNYRLKE